MKRERRTNQHLEVELLDLECKQKAFSDSRHNGRTCLHKGKLKVACEKRPQAMRKRFNRVRRKMRGMKGMRGR